MPLINIKRKISLSSNVSTNTINSKSKTYYRSIKHSKKYHQKQKKTSIAINSTNIKPNNTKAN